MFVHAYIYVYIIINFLIIRLVNSPNYPAVPETIDFTLLMYLVNADSGEEILVNRAHRS